MADRLRVLLLAEACNPTWVSVPLVGYNFARALAQRDDLDITLVTHIKNRDALAADPIVRHVRLHIIDNEWLARPLYKLSTLLRGGEKLSWTINTAMAWPSYIAFERQVERDFRRRWADFDLIHRVTPLSPTLPSPISARAQVPMLLGPLNGGLTWPQQYPDLAREEREWLAGLRPAYRALPYYRSTYRHLAGVIAGSLFTESELPHYFHGQRFYLPENGADPVRFPIADAWLPPNGRFRFITVSRLVPYKGVRMTLKAIAASPRLRNCEFIIIGDGPQRSGIVQFVQQHRLDGFVQLRGWLSQPEIAQEMRAAQAFVFPSLREFGGGVVLEAMASGLPTIVVNYGGPGELTDASTGIPLPMCAREPMIQQLRRAMETLADDPARCHSFGAAAIARIRDHFTWDRKAAQLVKFCRATVAAA